MAEKVNIKIIAKQTDTQGETTTTEFFSQGDFYQKNNAYYLIYKESKITGLDNTTTMLKISPRENQVHINRSGDFNQKQNFTLGNKDLSTYKTPYGVFYLEVLPKVLSINIGEEKSQILLEYDLKINDEAVSYNELKISLWKN